PVAAKLSLGWIVGLVASTWLTFLLTWLVGYTPALWITLLAFAGLIIWTSMSLWRLVAVIPRLPSWNQLMYLLFWASVFGFFFYHHSLRVGPEGWYTAGNS